MTRATKVATQVRHLDPFIGALFGLCVVSRLLLGLAGVGMDLRALGPDSATHLYQLLDTAWLRRDLLHSVWSLTMQPPLYNLAVGLLLDLPGAAQSPMVAIVMFAGYVVTVLCSYGAMVLLGVTRRAAFVVTLVLVVLDPAQLLFSTNIFYATPTAALTAATAFLGIWTLAAPSCRRVLGFASCGGVLTLTNTMLQPMVLLIVLAALVIALPRFRRILLLGSLVPALVLVGWMGLSVCRVGTPATSTWFGMNVAHGVLKPADPMLLASMVAAGQMPPRSLVNPFTAPLSAIGVSPVRAGPRASSAATRPDGLPNLNNRAYVTVSSHSLADALTFIRHQPATWLSIRWRALVLWAVPADQYYFFTHDTAVAPAVRSYDAFVGLQASHHPHLSKEIWRGMTISPLQVSWTLLGETLLALFGGIIVIWRAAASRRRWALAVGLPWVLATQAFVVSTLTEYGENNRFRFEVSGPILVVATVVAVLAIEYLRRPADGGVTGRLDALGWGELNPTQQDTGSTRATEAI